MMNIKHHTPVIVSCAVLWLSIAGCGIAAEPDALAGPIPECKELLSVKRKAYIAAAEKSCSNTRTFEERMKNVGCEINRRVGQCESLNINMSDY